MLSRKLERATQVKMGIIVDRKKLERAIQTKIRNFKKKGKKTARCELAPKTKTKDRKNQ